MKDVISIKYGWNTIAWGRIMHLGQDLLGVKIHTSCKISKLFRGTKSRIGKIFGICFFLTEKTRLYRYYQNKNQLGVKSSSYINFTMKLLIKITR